MWQERIIAQANHTKLVVVRKSNSCTWWSLVVRYLFIRSAVKRFQSSRYRDTSIRIVRTSGPKSIQNLTNGEIDEMSREDPSVW